MVCSPVAKVVPDSLHSAPCRLDSGAINLSKSLTLGVDGYYSFEQSSLPGVLGSPTEEEGRRKVPRGTLHSAQNEWQSAVCSPATNVVPDSLNSSDWNAALLKPSFSITILTYL